MPNIYSSVWIPVDLNNVIQKTDTEALLHLENQGDIDWTDLDINTAGSGYVPTKANAVVLEVGLADSGFPTVLATLELRKKGEIDLRQYKRLRPSGRGIASQYRTMILGLDNDGNLQYKFDATGADTGLITFWLTGWIEPA